MLGFEWKCPPQGLSHLKEAYELCYGWRKEVTGRGWVGLMFQRLKLFPVSLFFQLGVGDFPPRWTLDPLKPYAQTHWSSISCFGHGCFSTMKKAINYMTTAEYVNNYANKFSNIMEIFLYFNNGGVCMDLDVCQRSMHV